MQRLMDWLTADLENVQEYIDDFLVFSATPEEQNAFSGFPQPVDGSYLKQLCAFLTQQESHAPPLLTSPRLNVITTALSTKLPAVSRVTETPCLCFPLSASLFSSE